MTPLDGPNIEAFMGGFGVGFVVVFTTLLLVGGVNLIRRFFAG